MAKTKKKDFKEYLKTLDEKEYRVNQQVQVGCKVRHNV